MAGKYAFSVNGDQYIGAFDSRDEALRKGLERASGMAIPPQSIYVGRRVAANPQAGGHARAVLANMTARSRELSDAAGGYLGHLSPQQIDDLDSAIEYAVLGWLSKQELMPTFFTIEAISEHPVPSPSISREDTNNGEVQDLGSVEYPSSLGS